MKARILDLKCLERLERFPERGIRISEYGLAKGFLKCRGVCRVLYLIHNVGGTPVGHFVGCEQGNLRLICKGRSATVLGEPASRPGRADSIGIVEQVRIRRSVF